MTQRFHRSTPFLLLAGAALAASAAFAAPPSLATDSQDQGPLALVTHLTDTNRARQRAVGTPGIMEQEDATPGTGPLALVTHLTDSNRARQRAVGTPDASELLK